MAADTDPPGADVRTDVVDLDLPLNHRHASTVRVVAASLGADAGFTIDEIEDVRLGVNEAVSILADVASDSGARLLVRFEVGRGGMTVTSRRTGVAEAVSIDDVDELAVRILRAVVDEFRVGDDGELVVVKHATAADGDD